MIEDYDRILNVSAEISDCAKVISDIVKRNNIDDLNDFISTIEGYSKYLATTVELHKDADIALKDLKEKK